MIVIILISSFFSAVDGWVRVQETHTTNYYLSPETEPAFGSEFSWNLNLRNEKNTPFYRGSLFGYPTSFNFENLLWQEAGISGYFNDKFQAGLSGILSIPGGSYSDFGYFEIKGWVNSGRIFKINTGFSYRDYFWESITDNFEVFSDFSFSFKFSKIEFTPSLLAGWKLYTGQAIIQDNSGMGRWQGFEFSRTVTVQSNAFRVSLSGNLYFYPDPWTTIIIWAKKNWISGDSVPDWSSLGIISDQELFQSSYNYEGWESGVSLIWDLPWKVQLRSWIVYSEQFYPYSPVADSSGNILHYGRNDRVFYIQNEIEKGMIGRLTLIFEFTYSNRSSDDYFRNYNVYRIGAGLRLHI